MTKASTYPGRELELFKDAVKWKKYFTHFIKPYIRGSVLEAGAGLGSNTIFLNDGKAPKWTLTEPDNEMAELLKEKIYTGDLPLNCSVLHESLPDPKIYATFDTIIYIDVLEHIEHDKMNLEAACRLLNPGGHLIVLSPAYNFLFSEFDKSIGHYRRYTKRSLSQAIPASLSAVNITYLDSLGFFLSLANRLLLRQSYPTRLQINFWNNYLIPCSKIIDKLVFYLFGKTILGIWKKAI